MKLKDLLKALRKYPPNTEVVVAGAHGFDCHYEESEFVIHAGFFVTDKLSEAHGFFVDRTIAYSIQNDGKELLDTTSSTVAPAIALLKPQFCNHKKEQR